MVPFSSVICTDISDKAIEKSYKFFDSSDMILIITVKSLIIAGNAFPNASGSEVYDTSVFRGINPIPIFEIIILVLISMPILGQ